LGIIAALLVNDAYDVERRLDKLPAVRHEGVEEWFGLRRQRT
jgi:hypothetical protein